MSGTVSPQPLPRRFFERPVLEVAPALLGCELEHAGVRLRLTEVEAYAGTLDPGSHAYRGRTPRTAVMFGPAGHLYLYFSYGMHWCVNLVCGTDGAASAVLLRAGEVVSGDDAAAQRRPGVPARDLARGPARLTRVLALSGEQNGLDFCATGSPVALTPARRPVAVDSVLVGPRVGVSGAGGDGAAYPWRFWVDGERSVTPYRPGKPRRPHVPT